MYFKYFYKMNTVLLALYSFSKKTSRKVKGKRLLVFYKEFEARPGLFFGGNDQVWRKLYDCKQTSRGRSL